MTYLSPLLITSATNHSTINASMQKPLRSESQEEDKAGSLPSTLNNWKSYIASLYPCRFPDLEFGPPGSAGFGSLEVVCLDKNSGAWQKHGFTLVEFISAAWSLILYRYTGSEQVCSASITAAVQDVAQVWIQSTEIPPSSSVIEFLRRLREERAKQDCFGPCPWRQLKEMGLVGQEAVFDTAVVTQSNTGGPGVVEVCSHLLEKLKTNLSAVVIASCTDDKVTVELGYCKSKIGAKQAENLAASLSKTINGMLEEPGAATSDLDVLSSQSWTQISRWNSFHMRAFDACISDEFEKQVQSQPDALALDGWDGRMTYAALSDHADRLAHHLAALGIAPGTYVPICFEKSMWATVAIMAILKAGGAFVPLDPAWPLSRRQFVLREVAATMVVASQLHRSLFDDEAGIELVTLGPAFPFASVDTSPPLPSAKPSDMAYILFTSGSTGVPKGVLVTHTTFMSSTFGGYVKAFSLRKGTRILQFAAYTFDACIMEILAALLVGATICVISDRDRFDNLTGAIQQLQPDFSFLTPSVASLLDPAAVPSLRTVILGGEKLTRKSIRTWSERVHLVNGYGPTETTVVVSSKPGLKPDDEPSNVGRSEWAKLWLVDPVARRPERLVGVGMVGEVLIEGPGVATGYLNNEAATQAAFIDNAAGHDARMYLSGDLGRYDADGNIHILGRRDAQVKLTGLRIELGEIEAHLHNIALPLASQVAADVVTSSTQTHHQKLCVFIELLRPRGGHTPAARQLSDLVKAELSQRVPPYMVPSEVFVLDEFPRMPASGKLDRRRLRQLGEERVKARLDAGGQAGKAPTSDTERLVQRAWAGVLELKPAHIGSDDNFFALGGDSINAIKLVTALQGQGWTTTVVDVYKNPRLCDMAQTISKTCGEQDAPAHFALVPDAEREQLTAAASVDCNIPTSAVRDLYPSTPLQEAFMVLGAMHEGAYVGHQLLTLTPDMDLARYQKAWETLVRREAILRTRLVQIEGHGMVQVVVDEGIEWVLGDDLEQVVRDDQARDMSLGSPLSRHTLVGTRGPGPVQHLWTVHHALYDGWSMDLLKKELYRLYSSDGESRPRPPFNAFIHYLGSTDWGPSRAFWKSYLAGASQPSFPPPAKASPSGSARRTVPLQHAAQSRFSASVVIQAAWALLMARYSDTDDIVFGTTFTGRTAPVAGIENMLGPTITTIPVRIRLADDKMLQSVLHDVEGAFVATLPHQHLGLQRMRGLSAAARNACDMHGLLVVQPARDRAARANPFGGQYLREDAVGLHTYSLALNAALDEGDAAVHLTASFDEQVLDGRGVKRLLAQMDAVVRKLASGADCPLRDLDLFSADDERDVVRWNAGLPPPIDACIHALFAERAAAQPQAPAVCSAAGEVSYAQLDRMSTRLAWRLVELGVRAETMVPLAFEKSAWTVVAMLAVLKAGGAFVLLDMALPAQRLQFISAKVGATVLVSSPRCAADVAAYVPPGQCIVLEDGALRQLPDAREAPDVGVAPANAAYIMFTSGSTGMPKGCVLTHGAHCSAAGRHGAAMGMRPGSRSMQFSSYSFAACIIETLTTLICGGCVCVLDDDERMNDVAGAIDRYRISWAFLTPSLLSVLDPARCPTLQAVNVGGESIRIAQIEAWAPRVRLGHGYGNAECCGVVTTQTMHRSSACTDVGAGVTALCWVVEPGNPDVLAPVGAVGELVVEGAVVGRGYIDEPEKTAAVFIAAPPWRRRFGAVPPGHRFYRTGDLVRYASHADGQLQYCGRKDTQIKFHGQRIELGEIEHHMQKALPPGVDCTVELVVPRDAAVEDAVIVAFLGLGEAFDGPEELLSMTAETKRAASSIVEAAEAGIRASLPHFMLPAAFVPLQKLPMTVSGKVYRKALRESAAEYTLLQLKSAVQCLDPRAKMPSTLSPAEGALASAWARVLDVDAAAIATDDNFFSLGADSVKAMALTSLLRSDGFRLTVTDIFRAPRLREMAARCISQDGVEMDRDGFSLLGPRGEAIRAECAQVMGVAEESIEDMYPCSQTQEEVLLASAKRPASLMAQVIVDLPASVDAARFRAAVNRLLAENAILRMRVLPTELGLLQLSLKQPVAWAHGNNLARYLEADRSAPMDFGDCLSRIAMVASASGANHFVWTVHHALYDGWSLPLVFQALSDNYCRGSAAPRPHFARYIGFLRSKDPGAMRNYWASYLAGVAPVPYPALPSESYEPNSDRTCSRHMRIAAPAVASTTASTVIRTAWALVLAAYSGTRDVVFGTVEHGRTEDLDGVADMLGPTVQTVPVRIRVDPARPVHDLLQEVRRQATEAYPFLSIGLRELRNLGPDGRAACNFTNMLVVQVPGAAANEGFSWRYAETDLGMFHRYPIVAKAHLSHGRDFEFELIYDSKCVGDAQAECMVAQVERVIGQLCGAAPPSTVGDIAVTVVEKISNLSQRRVEAVQAAGPCVQPGRDALRPPAALASSHGNATEEAFLSACARVLQLHPGELSRDSSFFEMGGDSVKAMQLVVRLRSLHLGLAVRDMYSHPRLGDMASQCKTLAASPPAPPPSHKPFSSIQGVVELDRFLQTEILPHLAVGKEAVEDLLVCPHLQREMFAASLLKNRGLLYYISLDFHGPVDEAKLRRAIAELVRRHSVLRTVFVPLHCHLLQAVLRPGHHEFAIKDVTGDDDVHAVARRLISMDKSREDAFGQPGPSFVLLTGTNGISKLLILRLSHAQFDGFSMPLIFRDLRALYSGQALPPVPHFADYLYARQKLPERAQWEHWSRLLRGATMTSIVANPNPSFQHHAEACVTREVDMGTWKSIKARSSDDALMAAWAVTLGRFARTSDVLFGHTVMNRGVFVRGGVENVLGPCVNTIPVRVKLCVADQGGGGSGGSGGSNPSFTFRDLLDSVSQQTLQSAPHEHVSLGDILRNCSDSWQQRLARFGSTVVWQDFDALHRTVAARDGEGAESQKAQLGRLRLSNSLEIDFTMDFAGVQCVGSWDEPAWDPTDLALVARPVEGGARVRFELRFSSSNLDQPLVEDMADALVHAVQCFSQRPDQPVSELVSDGSSPKPRIPAPPRKQPKLEPTAGTPVSPALRALVRRCWAVAFGWKEEAEGDFEEDFFRSGNVVTAAVLRQLYRNNGFKVFIEDILDRPTVDAQAALLRDLGKYP